eukprot:scaffold5936_cov268-Chaetoceros_neogracile.AAC.22
MRQEELDSPSLTLTRLHTLMQYLDLHSIPPNSMPSASSIFLVSRMIQARGAVTEMLSSREFFSFASNAKSVSASGVSLLFSALYQSEICNQPFDLDPKRPQLEAQRLTMDREFKSTVSKQEMPLNGYASSTSSLAILCFVERLLLVRYNHLAIIHSYTHEPEDASLNIIDVWSKSNKDLAAMSSSPKGQQNDYDDGIFYIPTMAFMMAYKTLRRRLVSKSSSENIESSLSFEVGKYISLQNAVDDPVVNAALRLIFFSKCLALSLTHSSKGCDENTTGEYALACVDREMNMVDSFVKSVKDGKRKDDTLDPVADLYRDTTKSEIISEDVKEITSAGGGRLTCKDSYFQELWEKMEVDESSDENRRKVDVSMEALNPNNVSTAVHDDNMNDSGGCHDNITAYDVIQNPRTDRKGLKRCDILQEYESNSLSLRPALLQMSKNAVTSEVEIVRNQIIQLLNDAGAQDGAEGISKVASLLINGYCTGTSEKPGDSATINSMGSDSAECVVFSDTLISSLSKVYIIEMMSTARVSIFLVSFVLPSIDALAPDTSRPASRELVTMLTSLAKFRPVECIHSLMIPILMGKVNRSLAIGNMRKEVSKAQCELLNRLVKTSCFPTNKLPNLIEETVLMKWTELSICVIMTILQKKTILNSITVRKIAENFEEYSNDGHLVKSSKFASFLHVFVTKYGSQIQAEGFCQILLNAARALKTILKKSIISALEKLQTS